MWDQKNAIKIEYIGDPVAKGRPRLGRYGVFTPEKTRKFEKDFERVARSQVKQKLQGPLYVEIFFKMRRPKSVKDKHHTKRPDLDNLIKTVDALNGVAWEDDAQICFLHATKTYVDPKELPRILVFAWTIDHHEITTHTKITDRILK